MRPKILWHLLTCELFSRRQRRFLLIGRAQVFAPATTCQRHRSPRDDDLSASPQKCSRRTQDRLALAMRPVGATEFGDLRSQSLCTLRHAQARCSLTYGQDCMCFSRSSTLTLFVNLFKADISDFGKATSSSALTKKSIQTAGSPVGS